MFISVAPCSAVPFLGVKLIRCCCFLCDSGGPSPRIEAEIKQFLRFIGSVGVLPVRYGILRGLNEERVAADRLDPSHRAVGSNRGPELHHPGNLQSRLRENKTRNFVIED